MAHNFGSLVFTPLVKALQEKYGSRRQYARMEAGDPSRDLLGPGESAFIADRDSFYLATVGSSGWPYIQHRGGPKGFLKVIDDHTIAFADFRGNKLSQIGGRRVQPAADGPESETSQVIVDSVGVIEGVRQQQIVVHAPRQSVSEIGSERKAARCHFQRAQQASLDVSEVWLFGCPLEGQGQDRVTDVRIAVCRSVIC